MPRDVPPPAAVEINLPGPGRRIGKVIPADDAGSFRIHCASTPIDQLHSIGWIDTEERDAAAALHEAFEAASVRPRLTRRYESGCGAGDRCRGSAPGDAD